MGCCGKLIPLAQIKPFLFAVYTRLLYFCQNFLHGDDDKKKYVTILGTVPAFRSIVLLGLLIARRYLLFDGVAVECYFFGQSARFTVKVHLI
jgi:hypothetical protein